MVDRGVHCSPKSAARGLITWAIDLWPYVNGKALVDKLDLESMNATELLDVLHYYFEVDNRYETGEQAEAVSNMRTSLYGLYGQTYSYGPKGGSASGNGGRKYVSPGSSMDFDDPIVPFDPTKAAPKPYVPPTKLNPDSSMPFGSILDAPIG
jgi:hypothetical protein